MKLFTDNPISSIQEDRYGFAPYASILANAIVETNNLPLCVGIFGAWGTGKSSLMQMIKENLTNQANIRTTWFNPWKYERKEELWNALIQTILYQIIEERTLDPKIREKAVNLAASLTWATIKKAITYFSHDFVSDESIQKVIEAFDKRDERLYRHINQFEESFSDFVAEYTKGGRLVIFIDDLDRCLPENAITILESIKLFIGHSSCIFVIGMDNQVVEAGIQLRFAEKLKLDGREYLDKIIQVPFYLPQISFGRLKNAFLTEGLGTEFSDVIWEIIRLGMDGNPRKTKRFVNCFGLARAILEYRKEIGDHLYDGLHTSLEPIDHAVGDIYLAKLLVFQMSFPSFYMRLHRNPSEWEHIERNISATDAFNKQDPHFYSFIRQTSSGAGIRFPPPPNEQFVISMLQAINLVTETPKESELVGVDSQ